MSDRTQNMNPLRMGLMGLQHMFAMFGATVLVPILTGLSVQVTLIGVGVGTLLFHFFAKGKIPAFLGSSFAIMAGIRLITDQQNGLFTHLATEGMTRQEFLPLVLPYATGAILVTGFLYLLMAFVVKLVGVKKFMTYMPTVVTAPTVILIGIMLAPWAIEQAASNLLLAIVTLVIVIVAATWGKGMVKIMPILLGLVGAYIIAIILHYAGMTNANGSDIINFARAGANTSVVGLPPFFLPKFDLLAILVMLPFALATVAEHVGDMVALSSITGEDYLEDPGLTRTLIGDGVASIFSGAIGGPGSTTYGENVGVVALTKVFNPRVVQLAAVFAVVLGFSPLVANVIYSIPEAIIGGASFMLYGMIAAVGIRNLVDHQVDLSKSKNLIIVAVMLVTGLGMRFAPATLLTFTIGDITVPTGRLGLAIAVVLGVVLNIILPGDKKEA